MRRIHARPAQGACGFVGGGTQAKAIIILLFLRKRQGQVRTAGSQVTMARTRFALLLTLALLGAPSAVSKSVKIGVEASWDNTPLVLEARSGYAQPAGPIAIR